jgi:AcrR family transcriptional regulator
MTPRHKENDRAEIMHDTRQRLLKAAGEEFANHGYDAANVNRIAKTAGYSIGTVYNYFPSKRNLMAAFIDEIGSQHVDFIRQAVAVETNPDQRMRAFFQAGFAFVKLNLTAARGIFNTLNGPDEGFKQQLFQVYAPLFQMLRVDILDPGVEQGLFFPGLPESTAGLLMLIYLGVGSQLTPDGSHWLKDQEVADFVLRAVQINSNAGDQTKQNN